MTLKTIEMPWTEYQEIRAHVRQCEAVLRNVRRVLDNYQNLYRDDPAQISYALLDINKVLE